MPSYTNSIERNLNDKLGEFPSVRDFGAKGDGVTDDSEALQNAIDAMGAVHGKLLIPPGKYVFSQTLRIQTQITIEGMQPTTRYHPRVPGKGNVGSLLYYTGTGIAVDVKNLSSPDAAGTKYVGRVILRGFRLAAANEASTGVRLFNVQESEIDRVSIGDAYDAAPGKFAIGVDCCGCNTHTKIHDGIIAGPDIGIFFRYDGSADMNVSPKVYGMNIFVNSVAAIKIQEATGLIIGPHNWFEGNKTTILIDNSGVPALSAVLDGFRFYQNEVYNSIFTPFQDCRFIKVVHGDDSSGILIRNARIVDNMVSSDTGSDYLIEVLYGSNSRVQDFADFVVARNDFWGGKISTVYSDNTAKVVWSFRDNQCFNHFWGSPFEEVPVFSGLGTWSDLTRGVFTGNDGPVVRSEYGLFLNPKSGQVAIGDKMFAPSVGSTVELWNQDHSTQLSIRTSHNQGDFAPIVLYDAAGDPIFYVAPNGTAFSKKLTLAGLTARKPLKLDENYTTKAEAIKLGAADAEVTGVLPKANGGTGSASFFAADGGITVPRVNIEGEAGTIPLSVSVAGEEIFNITGGGAGVKDLIIGEGGHCLVNGDIILFNGVATGGKPVRTNQTTFALEEGPIDLATEVTGRLSAENGGAAGVNGVWQIRLADGTTRTLGIENGLIAYVDTP